MTAPTRAKWQSIWLGTYATTELLGMIPVMAEVRQSQTAVFGRRLTIGPADQDSDDMISTLSMGDWSGGGQIEELTGADQSRYWWGIFEGRSPRQAALPPLVSTYQPNSSCTTCWPLGVTADKALFCFLESGTPKVWFFNETTDAFDYNAGAGVSITHQPVGKATEFRGSVFVPCGANGYKIIVDSGSGVPGVTAVAGAADPSADAATSDPLPVHFAVGEGRYLFALTTGGMIAKSLTGASGSWTWDYHAATASYPKIESGTTPYRLINFFNGTGDPTMYVVTSKGAWQYDRGVPILHETPIQFPQHPDLGKAAAVWRPGEDMWIAMGLDTVRYTASNVSIPLSGVSRDASVPPDYRGSIVDLEPEISCLYALIAPYATGDPWQYSAKTSGNYDGLAIANPAGVAADSNGKIWLCDTDNERIIRLTSSLTYDSVTGGSSGSGDGQFAANNGAWDVAVTSGDKPVVVDRGNHRVMRFTSAGAYDSLEIGKQGYEYGAKISAAGSGDGQFDDVRGICILSDNTVVVADENNERLQKLTNGLVFSAKAGSVGTGDQQFSSNVGPYGVARDASDNIYIADRGNNRIQKWTSALAEFDSDFISGTDWSLQGTFGTAGSGNGQLNTPTQIASDTSDNVYIVDSGNTRLQKFDSAGAYASQFQATISTNSWVVEASFGPTYNGIVTSTPQQVATDSSGNVYLCDKDNDRLVKLNSSGAYQTAISSLDNIKGVAVDSFDNVYVIYETRSLSKYDSGLALQYGPTTFGTGTLTDIATDGTHVYVVDSANRRVWKRLASDGTAVTNWGTPGTGNGQFTVPAGICVTGSEVYVGDQNSGSSRIQVFNTSGTYQRQWALAANPYGLSCDGSGNIWVTQFGTDQALRYSNTGTLQVTLSTIDPLGISVASGDILWISSVTTGTLEQWDETATPVAKTPTGVAVDSSGNIYVAVLNGSDAAIQKYTSGYVQTWSTAITGFATRHVATDGTYVYVTAGNFVRQYNASTGVFVTTWGGTGTADGKFDDPYGLVATSTEVYVVDRDNSRVQVFNTSGVYQRQWTIGPQSRGIALDASGDVWVASPFINIIKRYSSTGTLQAAITQTFPDGIALTTGDVLWAANGTGHTLAKWDEGNRCPSPFGVAVNRSTGRVYTTHDEQIKYWTSAGAFEGGWSSGTAGTLSGADWVRVNEATDSVYVLDSANDRVQYFSATGVAQGAWSVTSEPRGLAIHPTSGNVFVGDAADTITEYESDGTLLRTYTLGSGTGDGQAQNLYDLEFDSNGNLFTTDFTTERVTKYTATAPITGTEDGAFNLPEGIAIKRSSDRIYVADTGNNRVQYFTSAGVYEGQWGELGVAQGEFNAPKGIAVNQTTGNVYVVDSANDRVQVFTATGTFVSAFGATGTGNGQFLAPIAIAIDADTGNVFVADASRDDVQEFTSSGTYARKFGSSGSGDGAFTEISGITMTQDGETLYVSDTDLNRVQKFIAADDAGLYPHLQAFSGIGWIGMWEGGVGKVPTFAKAMSVTGGYRLWWGVNDGYAYTMKLRRSFWNPRSGILAQVDDFASTGYIETARADMGMLGFDKVASHVILFMRAASVTERLYIQYEIDDGGWQDFRDTDGDIVYVTDIGRNVLTFNNSLVDGVVSKSRGAPFNWIRFRLNMERGSDAKLSPVIKAFNLHFLKIPQNSNSFQFTVPLPKRKWRGLGPADISDHLNSLLESREMVFLRHQDRLYRGRLAQVTGVDATGRDFSGIRNVSFIEVQTNEE